MLIFHRHISIALTIIIATMTSANAKVFCSHIFSTTSCSGQVHQINAYVKGGALANIVFGNDKNFFTDNEWKQLPFNLNFSLGIEGNVSILYLAAEIGYKGALLNSSALSYYNFNLAEIKGMGGLFFRSGILPTKIYAVASGSIGSIMGNIQEMGLNSSLVSGFSFGAGISISILSILEIGIEVPVSWQYFGDINNATEQLQSLNPYVFIKILI